MDFFQRQSYAEDLLGCQVSSLCAISYNLLGKTVKLHLYPLLIPEDSSTSEVVRNLLLVCDSGSLTKSSSGGLLVWASVLLCFLVAVSSPFFPFAHRHDLSHVQHPG